MTFQENLSRPDITDATARYQAAARRLRNTGLADPPRQIVLSLGYVD
jgi:hypothetical protein